MKKILFIIGTIFMLFALASCDEAMTFTYPTDTETTEETTTGDTTTDGSSTTADTSDETTGETTTGDTTTEETTTTTEETTTTTEETTTEETTTAIEEQLSSPTNLSINNQLLTWDAVDDAVAYQVFVDGVFLEEVTTNEYDFSALEDDTINFTVQAIAPTGMQDSPMSLNITFMVNQAAEIDNIKTMLSTSNLIISDEVAFATELVNRGMTSTEMQTMMQNMELLKSAMSTATTIGDFYTELDTFMNSTENAEALMAAMVKVELPALIQTQIDYYQSMSGTASWSDGYTETTSETIVYTEQIEELQNMLYFLENHSDEAVQSVMIVVDYFMDVQNNISSEWVSDFDSLMETSSPDQIDILLAVSVKDEFINNLKNELPTLEEFTIFNQTMLAFSSTMFENNTMESYVQVPKLSQQMRLSIELFYDYLLMIDSNYINEMISSLAQESSIRVNEDILILQLEYLDKFLVDKQGDIDELKAIYTDEEKETFFFDVIVTQFLNENMYSPGTTEFDDLMLIVEDNIGFANILSLQNLTSDYMNAFLDRLVETDFALIHDVFNLMEIEQNYATYTDPQEYYVARQNAEFKLMDSLVMTLNPLIQNMTVTEYSMLMENILSFVITGLEIENYDYSNPNLPAIELILASMQNTTADQLAIMQAIFAEVDSSDIFTDIQRLYNEGIDPTNTNPDAQTYGLLIEGANAYINVYTDAGTNMDAMVTEIITLLNTTEVQTMLDITQTEVDELALLLDGYLQAVYDQALVIKDYDYTTLVAAEIEQIQLFVDITEGIFNNEIFNPTPEFPTEDLVSFNDFETLPRYTGSILYEAYDFDTEQYRMYIAQEDVEVVYNYYINYFSTSDTWTVVDSEYTSFDDVGYITLSSASQSANIIIEPSFVYDNAVDIYIYVSPDENNTSGDFPSSDLIVLDDITGVPRYSGSILIAGSDSETYKYRIYVSQDNPEIIYNMYLDYYNNDATWSMIGSGYDAVTEEGYLSLVIMENSTGLVIGIYPSEEYTDAWEIMIEYTPG